MGTTSNQSYPYPDGSDAVDVPGDIEALADALDVSVTAIEANDWVTTARIDDGAVTTAKIDDDAVTTAKIDDGAVTLAKIDDGAVTAAKLATDAVETAKIDDGAVTLAKTTGVLPLVRNRPVAPAYLTNGSIGFATGETVAGLEGFLVAVPIPVYAGKIDRVAVKVNTAGAASAAVRLGLYADNGGQPGALIVDSGTAAADTTGVKEITVSPSVDVSGGIVWGCSVVQGAAATKPALAVVTIPLHQMSYSIVTHAFDNAASASLYGWYRTSVGGALPDPFNATGPVGRVNSPVIAVRMGLVS